MSPGPEAPRDLAAGSIVADRYRLISRIAGGGMGDVWRAEDVVLSRTVAIKFLRDEFADDKHFRERLRREARAAGSISHPGVVPVFDYGEIAREDAPYLSFIVMEFVDGPSLATELLGGPLSPERTLLVISLVARALQAAHDAGVVHRDIKPANILVTPSGEVKLTDFGISHAADAAPITRTGVLTGTATYFSPEQAGGQRATRASDIYSLGVVAYACLTGKTPFAEGNDISIALAHIRQQPAELPPDVPTGLQRLVMSMLEKEPSDRPASATAIAVSAEALLHSTDATVADRRPFSPIPSASGPDKTRVADATRVGPPLSGTPRRRRPPWKVAAVSFAIILIVALLLLRHESQGTLVPSMAGAQKSSALATLKGEGLTANVNTVDAVGKLSGVVIKQSVPPGAEVDDGALIVLTVASGKVSVPTMLNGLSFDSAAAALAKSGLVVRKAIATSSQSTGTVIDASPTGRVAEGTTITLTVTVTPATTDNRGGRDKGKKDH